MVSVIDEQLYVIGEIVNTMHSALNYIKVMSTTMGTIGTMGKNMHNVDKRLNFM